MIPYDSLAQTGKGFSAYDNWAVEHPVLNWTLATLLLIITLIIVHYIQKRRGE